MQSTEREKDALNSELQASRKQCSDAATEVRSCQAAAAEQIKAVSCLLTLTLPVDCRASLALHGVAPNLGTSVVQADFACNKQALAAGQSPGSEQLYEKVKCSQYMQGCARWSGESFCWRSLVGVQLVGVQHSKLADL